MEQTNKFSVLNRVENEELVMGDNSICEGGERLYKSIVHKEGFSVCEGVVFPVDPIHVSEEVIGDI